MQIPPIINRMQDGREIDCHPNDVVNVPPGHDAWVVGTYRGGGGGDSQATNNV